MPGRRGPPLVARLLPEVIGSILDFGNKAQPRRYRMYISGDTMVFRDIHEFRGVIRVWDMALLHLGGGTAAGARHRDHGCERGHQDDANNRAEKAIPIHYNDYDVFKSLLSDFEKEIEQAGLRDKVIYLEHGDQYEFYPDAANVA